MPDPTTSFNTSYIASVVAALGVTYLVNLDKVGTTNTTNVLIKFFIVPLVTAFATLTFLNMLFPTMNRGGRVAGNYVSDTIADKINNMNYMQIFPPIFLVFIMFMVLVWK